MDEQVEYQDGAENVKYNLGKWAWIDLQPLRDRKTNARCQEDGEKIINK